MNIYESTTGTSDHYLTGSKTTPMIQRWGPVPTQTIQMRNEVILLERGTEGDAANTKREGC